MELGLTAQQAVAEAGRCLQCATCCECRVCEEVCRDVGAIDHDRTARRIVVSSPAVIVANEDEIPQREVLGQDRVYRVGNFRRATDMVNVLMAGSASAGRALADAASLRGTAAGDLSPGRTPFAGNPERIGVFVCTCNGSMASGAALERIRDLGRACRASSGAISFFPPATPGERSRSPIRCGATTWGG